MALLCVRVLFRSKRGFESLPHVVETVSLFLDSSVELPLEKASTFGSVALLNRIWGSLESVKTSQTPFWSARRLLLEEESYKEPEFWLVLVEACKNKDLPMVKWTFEHFPGRGVCNQVVKEAAADGAMEILQYFCDNELDSDEAATSGVDSGLEPREIVWGGKDTLNAASGGHSDIVRWLYHFNYGRDDDDTMKAAMARGDVNLVRWLHRVRRIPICGEEMAAANGHLNMLQTLLRGRQIPPGVMAKAAESGHLDIIRWLVELDWSNEDVDSDDDSRHSDDFYYSGYGNSYDEERPPYLTSTGGEATLSIHTAAINGHLDVAKYLHAHVDWPLTYKEEKTASKRKS
ncbi:Ankyrin repeat-containing domain [Phytophthora cactorum]|nr:Ankyrin repeat-containing domain [Phytophthora cactorum]